MIILIFDNFMVIIREGRFEPSMSWIYQEMPIS